MKIVKYSDVLARSISAYDVPDADVSNAQLRQPYTWVYFVWTKHWWFELSILISSDIPALLDIEFQDPPKRLSSVISAQSQFELQA